MALGEGAGGSAGGGLGGVDGRVVGGRVGSAAGGAAAERGGAQERGPAEDLAADLVREHGGAEEVRDAGREERGAVRRGAGGDGGVERRLGRREQRERRAARHAHRRGPAREAAQHVLQVLRERRQRRARRDHGRRRQQACVQAERRERDRLGNAYLIQGHFRAGAARDLRGAC